MSLQSWSDDYANYYNYYVSFSGDGKLTSLQRQDFECIQKKTYANVYQERTCSYFNSLP